MSRTDPKTVRELRKVMDDFLAARRDAKLEKLKPDDPKWEEVHAQYERSTWTADAARRVSQIQAATHTLKAIHPDAKGSNLYCQSSKLPESELIGSHILKEYATDVIGNAAALDVNKFLTLTCQGSTLLTRMQEDEETVIAALDADKKEARQWVRSFLTLIRNPDQKVSHPLAKQLYWLVGYDPLDKKQFHLLAPLYASSLAHRVYEIIQEHRFGEDTKAAREARKNGGYSDLVLHEYPNLAEQKMGGTKPQNISQLNSERKGVNYLLASCPPVWQTQGAKRPYGIASIFKRFSGNKEVRVLVQDLRRFLESDPASNLATHNRRDDLLSRILGELRQFTEEFRTLPPGWSADSRCRLVEAEQCWLDPKRTLQDADFALTWQRMDWMDEIRHRFGNWLNAELGQYLTLGDIQQEYWTDFFDDETWRRQVSSDRREIDKEAQNA